MRPDERETVEISIQFSPATASTLTVASSTLPRVVSDGFVAS